MTLGIDRRRFTSAAVSGAGTGSPALGQAAPRRIGAEGDARMMHTMAKVEHTVRAALARAEDDTPPRSPSTAVYLDLAESIRTYQNQNDGPVW